MTPFTENVIEIIKNIPEGKVMTYGQIACLAGSPRGARQVARILHSMSTNYQLPWYRVINAKGQIVVSDQDQQRFFLECEGVEVSNTGHISLEKYGFGRKR